MAALLGIASTGHADDVISNEVVLELAPGYTMADVTGLPAGYVVVGSVPSEGLHLLVLPAPMDDDEVEALEAQVAVDDAEAHFGQDLAGGQTQGIFYDALPGEFDGQYTWTLTQVAAAWERSTGHGVKIAVLDTGVDGTHPDLVGAIVAGGYDFIDDDADPSDTANGIDEDGDGMFDEMRGHGTMVAGLIHRVAPDASILPVRILDDDGHGSSFRIAAGIYHAIAQGAQVINLSLGSTEDADAIADAVEVARDLGIVVVAAVGGDGLTEPAHFPAADDAVIGVAATDQADHKSIFSNYGEQVFITSPGTDIISLFPGGGYKRSEGTSFSSALVAGAVALMRATGPLWSVRSVEERLAASAADIDAANPPYEGQLGSGRLDIAAAINLPSPGDLDESGLVDFGDLIIVLAAWGPCDDCAADLNDDGGVDLTDLLMLLSAWGLP